MAEDPKARRYTVAYEGGTATATLGLLQYLFGVQEPAWSTDNASTTPSGKKRYKYGTKRRNAAAAGKEVFLDLGEAGVFSVRVTGDVVDFIDEVVSRASGKVLQAWTRRGTEYGPQVSLT